jgi:carboxyl-terminal processing protease
MKLAKKSFKAFIYIPVVFVAAFLGIATTTIESGRYFEISKNIEIFTNLYKEINTFYVDDVDPSSLMRTGIDAMLESLDPYTNYISESEIEGFKMIVKGRYSGIGATIERKKGAEFPFISESYENFPAQKAGIKPGDILLSIDGKSTKDKTTDDVSDILRGAPETSIALELRRPNGEKYKVNVTRQEIQVPNVPYYGMVNENIGYITLTTFTEQAGKNVADALRALQREHPNMKGIIFDLRNNGGGLLDEAVNVSNVFVPKGETVVTTRGKIKDWDRDFPTVNAPVDLEIPLIVLINKGSASASEIVSGVIQDLDRGVLVGQKSYGKGLVQNTRDVGFNSRVKLTTAKYYIPSGRCIQSVSYKDGLPVEIPDSLRAVFKTKNNRPVFDGGGVIPDVKIMDKSNEKLITALVKENLIFDFATNYYHSNPNIKPAKEFSLTDAEYQAFIKFLSGKDYAYDTDSEKALNALEKSAKEENYYASLQADITRMKKQINDDKTNDLTKYRKSIQDLLEREIVSRYYYEKGKIEVGLKNDEEVKEAIKLINDPTRYKKILAGQ